MIINGIEYNIRLYVDDEESEKEITEQVFEDFDQMNAFIEKTWRLDKYADVKAQYTFVEVIDGIPENAGTYFFEVEPYMPLIADEIEDIIYEMTTIVPKEEEESLQEWEKELAFTPSVEENAPGDESKEIPLSEYSYICPRCFNEVHLCTCKSYPYTLIQIDRLMVPIIKELNLKGYRTTYCCAGHPRYKNLSESFSSISFRENYDFYIPFPYGAKYSKSNRSIQFEIPKYNDLEALENYQRECIDKLMAWAKALPLYEAIL